MYLYSSLEDRSQYQIHKKVLAIQFSCVSKTTEALVQWFDMSQIMGYTIFALTSVFYLNTVHKSF